MIYRIEHHEGFGHVSHVRAGDYDSSSFVDVYFDHIRRARDLDLTGDSVFWVDEFGEHYMMDATVLDEDGGVAFIDVRYTNENLDIDESCETWVIRPVRKSELAEVWRRRVIDKVRHVSYYEQSHQGAQS